MHPNKHPDISFKLDCGRVVSVDAFVWEPNYEPVIQAESEEKIVEKIIAIKRLTTEKLSAGAYVHYIPPSMIDDNPPRLPNSALTVWLRSEPVTPGALYSFAVVLFFTDYIKETSIEAIMRRCLYDFDWEEQAEDIDEAANHAWKTTFLNRTLH